MRRTLPLLGALTLLAACGPGEVQVTSVDRGELGFILQVVDASGDSGAGMSMTGDAEGNPHLSYLVLDPPPEEGQPPPGIQVGVPLRPTVMHAHYTEGAWTHSPVAEEADVTREEDETAIVVDADGVHHVAWTQGGTLLYASNAEGAFGEPHEVYSGAVTGLSIAAGEDGAPAVAFYEELSDAEGPVALVRAAALIGEGRWTVETVAEADPRPPMTTGIGLTGAQAIVAFGSDGQTMVARRDFGPTVFWRSEPVDEGGLGVSLALDADGNPHLAYYTSDGEVRHAHSIGGSAWEITPEVALAGDAPGEGWSTSIDLAEDGTHHIAYKADDGIGYRSNADGDFTGQEWLNLEPAVDPEVVAGPEGIVHVAWYDAFDLVLTMATHSEEEPLLAVPSEETGGAPPAPPPTGDPGDLCEPDEGTELTIAAPPGAAAEGFDRTCLAVPQATEFTVEFDNQDEGGLHNVAFYTEEGGEPLFETAPPFPGPDTVTYQGPPQDEGLYWYQCDAHPTTMVGSFVVA